MNLTLLRRSLDSTLSASMIRRMKGSPHIPGSHTALVIEINTADIDWQEQNVTVSAGLLQAVRFRYIPHRHPADFAFIAQSALGSVHVAVGLFGLGA